MLQPSTLQTRLLAGRVIKASPFSQLPYRRLTPSLYTPIRHSSSSTTTTTKTPKTFYTLFPTTLPTGPPPTGPFTINLRALRAEFLKLQQSTHPDLFPPSLRKSAETASAQLNKAYTTLCSPLLRAEYLLTLRGYTDPSSDETHQITDHELLMEVLEANEVLENAREEGELVELRERNEERIEECIGRLEELFKADRLDEVRVEVVKLKYWVNVAEGLKHWEPGKGVSLQH
ncbi:hypothetical protein AOL_s00078g192 [Orbilia oligospora ATCC 24927]|uniref:Co-chaperone HscB C-terminal oligomerisation domain-containing protein n=1 Tax=Arthrobotrys oligospora (strain ATCC 24927 / CBS 115.81 / DSM 1491) TaxID=756982 RepID=G1XB95_ARTOA|nr:hypothetical protein AOL_s00078g192 [Orbilia oligospora ATCC 24927]EGX49703.1 hypothetical protein AOL_s00078g192 [Orbilia oligospora ATCC 24927]